MIAKKIRSRGA